MFLKWFCFGLLEKGRFDWSLSGPRESAGLFDQRPCLQKMNFQKAFFLSFLLSCLFVKLKAVRPLLNIYVAWWSARQTFGNMWTSESQVSLEKTFRSIQLKQRLLPWRPIHLFILVIGLSSSRFFIIILIHPGIHCLLKGKRKCLRLDNISFTLILTFTNRNQKSIDSECWARIYK